MRRNLARMRPAQQSIRLLLKLLVLLAGHLRVQSLILADQQQLNATSEATTPQVSANNASLAHEPRPHVSIVRSGMQSSELSNIPTSASLESRQYDVQRADTMQANKPQSTPLQAAANHRPASVASNHQNWPIEPYPSASYTTLSVQPATGARQLLASRERQHDFEELPAYNQQQLFMSSLTSGATPLDTLQLSGSAPAPLNTGLIQNLTAGLFPVNKLSNATLPSLSELLARTKHSLPTANNQSAPQSWPTQSATFDGAYPSSSPSNYLEALLGDHRFNSMLDYLGGGNGEANSPATSSSQFGHREHSSMARLQSQQPQQQQQQLARGNLANSNLFSQTSQAQRNNHKQLDVGPMVMGWRAAGQKSTSNVHNTYLPLKEKNRLASSQQPPMTNGQMLNMAASLYDNYLDQNYRYPHQHQQRDAAEQQYQFIQAHQANNQNHLDKVVYHSTPFRPSIVSPPQQSAQLQNSSQLVSVKSHQRPRSEADSKSMSYASLASGSSNSRPPDFAANSSRVQANKSEPPPSQHESDFDSIFDHINQQQQSRTSLANQTAASKQQQQQSNYTAAGSTKRPTQAPQPLSGPQLLLDLYERAIDSQIQEAIYTDHQQHFQHLGSLAAASPPGLQSSPASSSGSSSSPQTSASINSQTNWPFDDSPAIAEPSDGVSQLQAAAGRQPTLGRYQQLPTTGYSPAGMDSLAGALQELPTFSASDLQPIMPQLAAEPTYSLLPTAGLNVHDHHHQQRQQYQTPQTDRTPDASSLVTLAAQLFGQQQLFGASETAGAELASATSSAAHLYDSRPAATPPPLVFHSASRPALQTPKEHASTGGNGLASLFNKLQASQISSILTSPFAHLYANLPRYRYAAKSKQPAPATTTSAAATSRQPASADGVSKQQSAAAAAAAAAMATASAANLIAASGQTLTPLQAAILQAQAANNAYLNSESPLTEQARVQSALATNEASQLSLSSGLAGGGVSPLVWRQLLAPINWARKQTNAPNSTNAASLHGSQPPAFKAVSQHRTPSLPLGLVNTIWNNNNNNHLPFNQLFATQQQQLASGSSPTGMAASVASLSSADKRPFARLKIKILKIPVAFYDSSEQTNGGLLTEGAAGEPLTAALNLMPVHLQPNPTAGLLASLVCPLHGHQHQHQQASQLSPLFSPASQVGPAFSLHGGASSTQALKSLAQQHNYPPFQYQRLEQHETAGLARPHASQLLSSNLEHTNSANSATDAAGHTDKPVPIRHFTDINQPTDLQVSPSTLSVADTSATTANKQQQQTFISKSS